MIYFYLYSTKNKYIIIYIIFTFYVYFIFFVFKIQF